MLLSMVLRLRALRSIELSPWHGYWANAAFLRIVQREDPAWSAELHGPGSRGSYTLSPLLAPESWSRHPMSGETGATVRMAEGEECEWRWTSTDPRLSRLMIEIAKKGFVFRMRAGTEADSRTDARAWGLFRCVGFATGPMEHPWAWRTSHEQLAARWFGRDVVTEGVHLRFLTPTTFRPLGEYRPLADPRWIFAGAATRWNQHAPTHLTPLVPDWTVRGGAAQRIQVLGYTLHAQSFAFEGKPGCRPVGFFGAVHLNGRALGELGVRSMNLLTDFLMFSGAGFRTTWGMGQVRRVPDSGLAAVGVPRGA